MSRQYKPESKSEGASSSSTSASKSSTIYSEIEALKKEIIDLKIGNDKLLEDNERQYTLIQELNMEICDWSKLYEVRGQLVKGLREQINALSEKKE